MWTMWVFFAMKGMGLLTSKLPYQETDDDQPMDLGVPDWQAQRGKAWISRNGLRLKHQTGKLCSFEKSSVNCGKLSIEKCIVSPAKPWILKSFRPGMSFFPVRRQRLWPTWTARVPSLRVSRGWPWSPIARCWSSRRDLLMGWRGKSGIYNIYIYIIIYTLYTPKKSMVHPVHLKHR